MTFYTFSIIKGCKIGFEEDKEDGRLRNKTFSLDLLFVRIVINHYGDIFK